MTVMKILLFRCHCGHYFRNISCPYDGWTHEGIREIEVAFDEGAIDSLESLMKLRVDKSLLERIIILEGVHCGKSLEGIAIQSYVIDGKVVEDRPPSSP